MNNPKISLKTKYVPTAEFYSQIIDSLHDYSIFTLNNDLLINSWSSGSTKIFGYEASEAIGEHFNMIFTEEDLKNEIPQIEIKTALKEGGATDNRYHIKKDKSLFYAYGLVFPLIGVDGEMLGYVKILQDLSEQKKAQTAIQNYVRELEELNTHKESVLNILSHDLRSPLTAIVGATNFLKDNFETMKPSNVQEIISILHKSSTDELEMLDYLVEWARIKYAADVFSPSKLVLVDYVNKVINSLKESALIKQVTLHQNVNPKLFVFADGKMLISIIQNILTNAIRHTDKGGSITVKAKSKENKIIVQIHDTGIGMTQKNVDNLFIPQIKALAQSRKKNQGAGIGLFLVKGFLEKNKGEIWVESSPGKGSSFFFTLHKEKPNYTNGSNHEILNDSKL